MTTKIKSGVISDNAITSAHISSGAISSAHLSSIDTDAVSEGSSNLYFTTTRARTSLSVTDSGGDGSLAYDNSTGVITYTGPSAAEVRAHISVTDSGGDGSLAYSNGVITYTGPSASEVRAHLSAGTGVTYSSGEFSIGQSVATTASPTFADINITGNLNLTGDINSYSVTDLDIVDQTITLGVGQSESASDGSGIVIAGSNASILWDESNDEWDFNKAINVTGRVSAESIEIGSGYGGTPNTESQLILSDSGNNYITIGSGASSEGGILFADSADNDVGVISYNHSTNSFDFRTNGVSNRMIIDSSGNVGIGQTPTNRFDVNSGSNVVVSKFQSSLGGAGNRAIIQLSASGNSTSGLQFIQCGSTSAVEGGANAATIENTENAPLIFGTNNTEKMRIDSNGNVGIGTDSPNSPLEIVKNITFTNSDTFPQLLIKTTATTTGNQLGLGVDETDNVAFIEAIDRGNNVIPLVLQRNAGRVGIGTDNPGFALDISNTTSAKINLQGGTNQNGIRFAAAGNDGVSSSLYYLGVGSDLMGGTDYGAVLLDVTNNRSVLFDDQSTSRLGFYNNSMVIDSSGNVGIGTSSPSAPLDVAGNFIFKSPANTLYGNFDNTTAGYGAFRLQNQGSNYGFIGQTSSILASGGSNTALGLRSENEFAIATGGSTERMRITSGGNVGIGTDSPTGSGKILHFNSSSNVADFHITNSVTGATSNDGFILRVTDPANVEYVNRETTKQIWYQAGTTAMVIGSDSNVGIGRTDGPWKKLDVRNSITTAGSHIVAHIGGNNHAAAYAIGLGFDPEGYGYRNKIAIFAEGTGLGYSRGRLHFALRGGNNSDEATIANSKMCILENGNIGIGSQIDAPGQLLTVATSTNYDPPGLGNSNATFSVLKKDNAAGGNYGMITGVSSDGNVWSQVQRTDGTATAYNLYLQPSGGSVGIGIPQNHTYIPNLIYPLRVGKSRTGVGNVTDYLTKIAIDAIGYGGSNYQMAAIDFTGGDTAGVSGNVYGRIGCSSMNGANNQESGSLEFFVRAPGYSMETAEAMKILGKVDTSSAGGGTSRNATLFPFQGIAIDRCWGNYPSLSIMNSTHYSTSVSTQAELRVHGTNVSSDSYPGTSGSDFSVTMRCDGGYVTGSDRRRKRDITTIDNALATVKQLTGKRFQTVNRSEEVQETVSKNGYKLGFIAQDVEDIIPEAVIYHEDEDDGTNNWNSSYAMDYGSVVALLVNAIKEQDTTIQDLKSRIETLEG